MEKDWKANSTSVFATLGASSHSDSEREVNDFYATDPIALELLLEKESFKNVWEPACGKGHLSEVLKDYIIHGKSSDLIDRGYGEVEDFLNGSTQEWDGDIVTNPPFKYALDFVKRSLELVSEGSKVAMFLRIQFLETRERQAFFKRFPIKKVYVCGGRIMCAKNGEFKSTKGSASCYAWFIWEKGGIEEIR